MSMRGSESFGPCDSETEVKVFHSVSGFSKPRVRPLLPTSVRIVLTLRCSTIKPILSSMFSSILSKIVISKRRDSAAPASITLENLEIGKSSLVSRTV